MTQEARGTAGHARFAWAAVTALLVLTGCTAEAPEPAPTTTVVTPEPEPEPAPEPEPEPAPTVDPGAVIERPAAMEDTGDEGAIAAAEYFAQIVHLTLTHDVLDEVRAMSNESCNFCASVVSSTEGFVDRGSTYVGGEVEVIAPGEVVGREDVIGVTGVMVPIRIGPAEEWARDGELLDSWDEVETSLYVEVTHTYLGWLVVAAGFSGGVQ